MIKEINHTTPVRLSVIMPCYNEERCVDKAIESILSQTFMNFELIIIDDHSTDKTPEILSQYSSKDKRIKVLRNDINLGYAASINRGIRNARAELIARMDADDICFKNRFQKQIEFLDNYPDIDLIGTGVLMVWKDSGELIGEMIPAETHEEIIKSRYTKSFNFHPTIMARKKLFDENNGYDESLKRAEELDLWLRASRNFVFHNIQEVLLKFAVNEGKNIKLKYWYYGFKVRVNNMMRRKELFRYGYLLIPYTINFFVRKWLGYKPGFLRRK